MSNTMSPSVVEVQPATIQIGSGVNERERSETADWKSTLYTCENYVVNAGGSLSRRKGMYITASSDDQAVAMYPHYRSLLTRGNTQGIYGSVGQFYDWSDKNSKFINKGKASEFGVKVYDVGANDVGNSVGSANDPPAIVGITVADTSKPDSCTMSSKYAVVTYGDRVILSDRLTGQTIRYWSVDPTAPYSNFRTTCTFTTDDRYLYIFRYGTTVATAQVTVIDTSAQLPTALNSWTGVGSILSTNITLMHCTYYSTYAMVVISDGTNTEVSRVTTAPTVTTLVLASFVGTGLDANGTSGYLYVSGKNATPKHEVRLVNVGAMTAGPVITSTLTIHGTSPRVCIDSSNNLRVISFVGENDINGYAVPVGYVYQINSGATDFTYLGNVSGWAEVTHPFCDRNLTNRFYAVVSKVATGTVNNGAHDKDSVSNCCVIDITSMANQSPIVDATACRWRVAAAVDNYTCLCIAAHSDSGVQDTTLPKPASYSNVYGFVYDKKIGDVTRAYTFVELTVPDPSKVHMAGDCMSGGVVQYYDGYEVAESGFVDRPSLALKDSGVAGGPGAGTYEYLAVFTYTDHAGKVSYSRTSMIVSITMATANKISVQITSPTVSSRKQVHISAKVYRTTNGGTQYYYVGSVDQVSTQTFMTTLDDITSDTTLVSRPVFYRQPGVANTQLDRFYAPHSVHIIQHKDRYVSASASNVYYTSFFVEGEAPWWNPAFYIPIPGTGNVIGLASHDGNLIIFKENSIYVVSGDGPPENGGTGNEFSPPERLSAEYGCIDARSIVVTPAGVFFRSHRGIELLTKKLQVTWIGERIQTTVGTYPITTGSCHNRGDGRVYIMIAASTDQYGSVAGANGVICVYDLNCDVWTIFKYNNENVNGMALQDCTYSIYGGVYTVTFLSRVYPFYEWQDGTYKLDYVYWFNSTVETHWIKGSSPNDRIRLTDFYYLAKQVNANHAIKISVGYDYDTTYSYSKQWEPGSLNTIEDLMLQTPKPLGRAFRFKVEQLQPTDTVTYPIGSGLGSDMLDLTVMIGSKGGGYKAPAAQRG